MNLNAVGIFIDYFDIELNNTILALGTENFCSYTLENTKIRDTIRNTLYEIR